MPTVKRKRIKHWVDQVNGALERKPSTSSATSGNRAIKQKPEEFSDCNSTSPIQKQRLKFPQNQDRNPDQCPELSAASPPPSCSSHQSDEMKLLTLANCKSQLRLLQDAKPRLNIAPFAKHHTEDLVMEIRRQWAKYQTRAVSTGLMKAIKEKYPGEFIPGDKVTSTAEIGELGEDSHVFNMLDAAYQLATESYTEHGIVDQWEEVAEAFFKPMLQVKEPAQLEEMLEVRPMRKESIYPTDLLPQLNHLASSKRINYGIFFRKSNKEVSVVIRQILSHKRNFLFAPAECLGTRPQLASVDVKSPDGSAYDSSLQLSTWLMAGLELLQRLREQGQAWRESSNEEDTDAIADRPVHSIGISIIGHQWLIFIAVKHDYGDVNN
ncbi:hypothetical protein AJ79_10330 [Helicocarpus griseus UAMH5409]|uniref:PD-(D/E)XK nuclease-like domain-containing protein n=1 Tax=Helicocarpus griseus UAMH5409 TaxID=1447875 RepID=A0A2B7WET4_9EURO|nr:hypothetical protein AJ79_10330 [Helicocarpus griseus UAMH5409]